MEGKCFVVYHGKEFNLKSLSIVALSEAECETWYRGLMYLIEVSLQGTHVPNRG